MESAGVSYCFSFVLCLILFGLFEKVGPCMKVRWVAIVRCGVLHFCFTEKLCLKKIGVDILPATRTSVYTFQNLHLAW